MKTRTLTGFLYFLLLCTGNVRARAASFQFSNYSSEIRKSMGNRFWVWQSILTHSASIGSEVCNMPSLLSKTILLAGLAVLLFLYLVQEIILL